MKTLSNPKITISADGKTATIIGEIVEKPFSTFFIQRSTISHFNPANLKHPRHVLISNEGVFMFYHGQGFAFTLDDFVAIAAQIEPRTTFAPIFAESTDPMTANFTSELDTSYQWQETDRIKPIPVDAKTGQKPVAIEWADIPNATQKTLDKSLVKAGQYVRCKATNKVGSGFSNPFQIK